MEWVKLSSKYYNDPAIMRAGEPAEVLFTRALAYCGDQETDGFVPAEVLPRLATTRAVQRAAALVREGLWESVDGGWRFVAWDRYQASRDQLTAHREAGRARAAKHRANRPARNAVTNGVRNNEITQAEVEVEVEAAAAAARETELPPPVEILKSKLEARKLIARWDKLTDLQLRQIVDLIDIHGDGPLVQAALNSFRPDSPAVFAQAWIASWHALPEPGTSLRLLDSTTRCETRGHTGDTRYCRECVIDAKVGDR